MSPKRRKVWVNEYDADDEGPGGLGDLAWQTKAAALASISSDGKAVAFVERLPGDVVLSREDINATANDVARELLARGWTARMADEVGSLVAGALLRGRR